MISLFIARFHKIPVTVNYTQSVADKYVIIIIHTLCEKVLKALIDELLDNYNNWANACIWLSDSSYQWHLPHFWSCMVRSLFSMVVVVEHIDILYPTAWEDQSAVLWYI